MKKIETFLNSTLYIVIVFAFALITWTIKGDNDTVTTFGLFNMIGIFTIIFFMTLVLIFYKNTRYAIPLMVSLLFVVNNNETTFETLNSFGLPYIILALIIIGPTVHIIRFRPKFKFHALTLGFLLIALAYLIPLIYTERSLQAYAISGVGILYLLFYIFLSSTSKGSIDYFFKMMVIINLLLVAEFSVVIGRMLIATDLPILEALRDNNASWGLMGWANVNDLAYYLTFTLPGYVYFIFKKPKNIIFWILTLLPAGIIILTESRGGFIGLAIAAFGLGLIILIHGKHHHYFYAIFTVVLAVFIGYLTKDILVDIYQGVIDTIQGQSINSFSSDRIWMYTQGLDIFEDSPWFGQGWLSIQQLGIERWFMFHSTVIQVLATMGIFGLFALLVHYFQIFKLLFDNWSLESRLILVGYVAVQIHGLVDNIQFSVPFSFLIAMLFPLLENASIKTMFIKEGRTFRNDSSLLLANI